MTEPDAGSDLQGIRTSAKRDGDDWIINGSKIYITNGWLTDCCIVVAKTKPDAKRAAHGVSLFLVDADTPGFHKGRKLKKLGLKGQDTAELFFEDVRVPGSALLGEENRGFYQLMEQLPQERLIIAVHSAAHCEVMFEDTRASSSTRAAGWTGRWRAWPSTGPPTWRTRWPPTVSSCTAAGASCGRPR